MNPRVDLRLYWGKYEDGRRIEFPIKPQEVIRDFFDCFELYEVKDELWDWLKTAMENEDVRDTEKKLMNMVFLYEKISDLVTACYIQNLSQTANK